MLQVPLIIIMMIDTMVELVQPVCFGADCYIEMATSYHQPHEQMKMGPTQLDS